MSHVLKGWEPRTLRSNASHGYMCQGCRFIIRAEACMNELKAF